MSDDEVVFFLTHIEETSFVPLVSKILVIMDNAPTFELLPAELEDVPRLAYIHSVACLPDNAMKLYFETAAEFEKRVSDMLKGQVGKLTWHHVKAVDKKTGKIAAWASWKTPTDAQIREHDENVAAMIRDSEDGKGDFDFPPGLPTYVHTDTDRWLRKWTRGRRHIICAALFTEPSFQRRGMGNAMVKYGNHLADKAKLADFSPRLALWSSDLQEAWFRGSPASGSGI